VDAHKVVPEGISATMYSWFCSFLLNALVSRVNRRMLIRIVRFARQRSAFRLWGRAASVKRPAKGIGNEHQKRPTEDRHRKEPRRSAVVEATNIAGIKIRSITRRMMPGMVSAFDILARLARSTASR
jgi:hypothetical protein